MWEEEDAMETAVRRKARFVLFFLNQGEIRCEAAHFLPAGGGGRQAESFYIITTLTESQKLFSTKFVLQLFLCGQFVVGVLNS